MTAAAPILKALDAKIVTLKPVVQIDRTVDMTADTDVLGDEQMRLKEWFGQHRAPSCCCPGPLRGGHLLPDRGQTN